MAHPRARAAQQSIALTRLVAGVHDLATALGISEPVIPTYAKDPTLLPILQLDAMSDFLDAVGKALKASKKSTEADGASSKK
jgi:hypothetical protein